MTKNINGAPIWHFSPLDKEQLLHVSTKQVKKLKGPECRVLEVLLAHQGQVVAKRDLLTLAWPGRVVSDASLTQSIAQLRLALGDNGKVQGVIKTVPYQGYLLFDNLIELVEPASDRSEPSATTELALRREKAPLERPIEPQTWWIPWGKKMAAGLLLLIAAIQTAEAVHRYTFVRGVQLDTWKTVEHASTTFFYLDNHASRKLYDYLSTNSAIANDLRNRRLLVSTGVGHYYIACVYSDTRKDTQNVKNLTFALSERFQFIGGTIDDVCR
ncbi:winged helix-turn-helix domain-containing protein [Vibrio coralliilyticus]|uniref:OmpR/PhoB-type domain-containing protein n=1 Tax=Vibrio coralliilyticus TaxID=190893 RepID=A0AAP7DFH5_9VIBR|nr:winged helix-turn-helix domain-containing protein [Vibrio coralliilyticus]ANW23726.1 hypothetical protein BA953_05545 [Vibrio coralliilyticus]NOJ24475.1 hypothetical protein [Vibrio coralliilyticus]